ncbi:MAG: histidine phosphatase family protein [Acutalibacteraceae bacterium]|nr:histidine phosphatase family protein [Acutalibacteraceae bacterium]
MKLLIIRHGDPDYSIDSLTEKGRREAELLKNRLVKQDIKDFYSSPLGRARATAEPTLSAFGKQAEICPWLEEFSGYISDPKTGENKIPWDLMPEYWTNTPNYFDKDKWTDTPLMSSGNVKEKYGAAVSGIDKLLEKYGYIRDGNLYMVQKESRDTVALFCHFGVECVLLSHILNISPVLLWHGFVALTSSVTTLITEERESGKAYFRCCGFGDISHLYAGEEPPSFQARFCETYLNFDERH